MKKIIAIISVILIVAVSAIALAGCGGNPFLTSAVWSDYEVLSYDIFENDKKIGTTEITIEKLKAGQYKLRDTEEAKFAVGPSTRVTKIAKDLDGKEIMYSASLSQRFVPVASYKKVDYNKVKQETRSRYHKGNYYYANDGGSEKKVKIKKNFLDNENLHELIRCQELHRPFNKVLTTIDSRTGAKEKIAIAVKGEGKTSKAFTYNNIEGKQVNVVAGQKTHVVTVAKSVEPKGKPFVLQYIQKEAFDPAVKGGIAATSYYQLVQIEENNLVYKLTNIKFGK